MDIQFVWSSIVHKFTIKTINEEVNCQEVKPFPLPSLGLVAVGLVIKLTKTSKRKDLTIFISTLYA